jgi:hypothetical protein
MKQKEQSNKIDRRAFLRTFSQAVGYTAAASIVAGSNLSIAFAYTPKSDSASRAGVTFTKAQMQTLQSICATVIPRTDTASAADVDCHGFIDHQLLQCHSKAEQAQCIRAVELVDSQAQKQFNQGFSGLDSNQQTQVLVNIEAQKGVNGNQKGDFKKLKSLIVFGYFTSEEGVKNALFFQPYPGGYKGSIKVDENTKTSGSLAYY